jgi:ADP-dependent NAD(P)H-hydrate dehydratase / NAD(P)H-hydrate epimerase
MATGVPSITQRWVARHLPARPSRAHKGDFGRLLVIAGSIDYPGAALLTALGAMRAGAGLVRVAAADSVVARLAGSIPELTWMALDEEAPGLIAPGGWRRLTSEAPSFDAIVIGPGLGSQPATQRRARQLIGALDRPGVVDADGLNALASGPRWWQSMRAAMVLTPHPGEFAGLAGRAAPDADDDEGRAVAAAEAALRWDQVVVLKGAHTVVAEPGGQRLASAIATPALATAGSGDVLAGAIGAFLAAGVEPFAAAACGVAVHGAAGLIAADRIGSAGVMARDIAALLPEAIGQLRSDRGR